MLSFVVTFFFCASTFVFPLLLFAGPASRRGTRGRGRRAPPLRRAVSRPRKEPARQTESVFSLYKKNFIFFFFNIRGPFPPHSTPLFPKTFGEM